MVSNLLGFVCVRRWQIKWIFKPGDPKKKNIFRYFIRFSMLDLFCQFEGVEFAFGSPNWGLTQNLIKNLNFDSLFNFFNKIKLVCLKGKKSNLGDQLGSNRKSDWTFEPGGTKVFNSDMLFDFLNLVNFAHMKSSN